MAIIYILTFKIHLVNAATYLKIKQTDNIFQGHCKSNFLGPDVPNCFYISYYKTGFGEFSSSKIELLLSKIIRLLFHLSLLRVIIHFCANDYL